MRCIWGCWVAPLLQAAAVVVAACSPPALSSFRVPPPARSPPVIPTIDPRPPLTPSVDPPPLDTRVQDLELQVFDLQSEVTRMRDDVANLAKVASMASDEAQQATLRMDQMEHEWLAWGDGGPEGEPAPQQPGPQGGNHLPYGAPLTQTVPTPQNLSPRTQEAHLQRSLLQLEDDPLVRWYNSGTPGLTSSALIHAPPQAAQGPRSLSPPGGMGSSLQRGWRRPAPHRALRRRRRGQPPPVRQEAGPGGRHCLDQPIPRAREGVLPSLPSG